MSYVDGMDQPPLLSREDRGETKRSYGTSEKSSGGSGEHAILVNDVSEPAGPVEKNWVHVRNFISIWRLTAISVVLGLLVGAARAPSPNQLPPLLLPSLSDLI